MAAMAVNGLSMPIVSTLGGEPIIWNISFIVFAHFQLHTLVVLECMCYRYLSVLQRITHMHDVFFAC